MRFANLTGPRNLVSSSELSRRGVSRSIGSHLNASVRSPDSRARAKTYPGRHSEEMRERVTGLYGVEPTIDFVEIAQLVDNSAASQQE